MPYRKQFSAPLSNNDARGINAGHPLARGLVFCAVPLGNGYIDLVSGQIAAPPTTYTRRTRSAKGGRAIANSSLIGGGNGGAFGWAFPKQTGVDKIAGAFSLFVEGSPEVNGVNNYSIRSYEGGSGFGLGFRFDDVNVINNGFFGFNDNGSRTATSSDSVLGTNAETFTHRVMYTIDGTTFVTYANGKQDATGAQANAGVPTANANRRTYIAMSDNATGSTPSAAIIALWNRVLKPSEYFLLYQNPMVLLAPVSRRRIISQVASSGVSGTVASTDVRDTSSASGTVKVTGTVAASDVRDTISAAGTVKVTGSAASSDRRDSSSVTGTVKVTGTVTSSDTRDTSSASGTVKVTGSAASTDVRDNCSAAGSVGGVIGTCAASDRRDSSSASGLVKVLGTASTTDVRDTSSCTGTVEVVAGGGGVFFEADLFAHLMADATVSTLTDGARVYPVVRPQGQEDFPTAVYQVITAEEAPNLGSWAGDLEHYRLQVDCWARTDAEASALADAVRARMRTAASNIRAVMLPGAMEDFEPETRLYRVLLEFSCWYDVS